MQKPGFPKHSREGDRHVVETNGAPHDVYMLIDQARRLPVVEVDTQMLAATVMDDACWDDASGKKIQHRLVVDAVRSAGAMD